MPSLDIVGLGLATLDVMLLVKEMPTWENPGRLGAFSLDGGGPVGTACVAAARLGARVGFVGTAGNDLPAEIKMRTFHESGVDLSRLVRRSHPENHIVVVYVHEETGERFFCGLGHLRQTPLEAAELDRDYVTSAPYLHLDGFDSEAALQAAKWMQAAGKKVALDAAKTDGRPVPPHLLTLIPHVNILICGSGFGLSATGHKDLSEAGRALLAMGPEIVVQTEGKDGCYTTTASDSFHTPAFTVDVVDTTGAGDVFHGAYLVGLLHGWDLRSTALFATATSAIQCMHLGGRAGIPSYTEVIAFLSQQGINLS
jgi:sulfofructose kinase